MTVIWSAEAQAQLAAIHEHVARDAPRDADALIRRLVDRVVQLEAGPQSGRRVPEYPDDDLRELLSRPYRIIYRQRRSRFIVDSLESARLQAAEFHNALEAGVIDDRHMVGEIGQVLNGEMIGRENLEQITVYKSLGHIVQDLTSAVWLYRKLSS